jgi:hypothetical protein
VRHFLLLVCLAVMLPAAPARAQKTAPTAAATVMTKTCAAAMLAVAQAMVEDTWTPLLDNRIQASPAAAALGADWKPSDPRWRKAREALGGRMALIFDRYARSNELAGHIATEIGRIGAGPDLDAAIAAVTGAAGPALVRHFAKREFIVLSMSDRPDGPKVGTPEWNTRLGDLGRRFDARVGAGLGTDDGSHAAEVEKLATGPAAALLSRLWMFGISNAQRQLNTALNLMVFDDQAAIDKAVAAAVGAPPKRPAATAATDAFSLEKMAVCQDSWLDWGADEARVGAFRDSFRARYKESPDGGYFVPISGATLMGMKVARVYSSSIGMARGFSVAVEAPFDVARKNVEKTLGKTLQQCETGDGMRTCALEIAEKRTVMLMADATGREKTTLVGCFYFYEK